MHCFFTALRAFWGSESGAVPSGSPARSLVLLTARRTACVVPRSALLEGTAASVRVLRRTPFPLWFSNVFERSAATLALGVVRRSHTSAARRVPVTSRRSVFGRTARRQRRSRRRPRESVNRCVGRSERSCFPTDLVCPRGRLKMHEFPRILLFPWFSG